MPIEVACQCGKRYQAKDEAAGKILLCPSCRAHMQVPDPGADAAAAAVASLDVSDPEYQPAPHPAAAAVPANIFAPDGIPWYYPATVWLGWLIAAVSYLAVIYGVGSYMEASAEAEKGRETAPLYSTPKAVASGSLVGVPLAYALAATFTALATTVGVDAATGLRLSRRLAA